MTQAEYIDHYRQHYRTYGDKGSGTGEYERKLALWKEQGYTNGMSVLDYGCGWGAMLPGITNRKDYLGVDIAPEALEIGREKFPEANFQQLEIGKLDCPQKDFVCAMSVFTHARYEDVPDCLRDLHRSLKEKGFGLIDFLRGECNEDPHVRFWPEDEFLREVRKQFKAEVIGDIAWPGFTHTYVRIWK